MIPPSRLETADIGIHPELRSLADRYSGKLNIDFLFETDKYTRVALNLVSEPTGEKRTVGIAPRSATTSKRHGLVTSMTSEAIQEDILRYMAEICHSGYMDRKIHKALLRFGLECTDSERTGILVLEHMAGDLRKIYELKYIPSVYRNGIFVR